MVSTYVYNISACASDLIYHPPQTYQIAAKHIRVLARSPVSYVVQKTPTPPPPDVFNELSEAINEADQGTSSSEEEVSNTLESSAGSSKRHKK